MNGHRLLPSAPAKTQCRVPQRFYHNCSSPTPTPMSLFTSTKSQWSSQLQLVARARTKDAARIFTQPLEQLSWITPSVGVYVTGGVEGHSCRWPGSSLCHSGLVWPRLKLTKTRQLKYVTLIVQPSHLPVCCQQGCGKTVIKGWFALLQQSVAVDIPKCDDHDVRLLSVSHTLVSLRWHLSLHTTTHTPISVWPCSLPHRYVYLWHKHKYTHNHTPNCSLVVSLQ